MLLLKNFNPSKKKHINDFENISFVIVRVLIGNLLNINKTLLFI